MLSLGGITLRTPTVELSDWVARHFPLPRLFPVGPTRSWPGLALGRSSWPTTGPAAPLRLGCFVWPTWGASRFAYGLFLATREDYEAIAEQAFQSGPDQTQSVPLVLSAPPTETPEIADETVEVAVYVLPGIPLSPLPESPWRDLPVNVPYLVPVVDQRYYWWYRNTGDLAIGASGDNPWSWAGLVDALANRLGIKIAYNEKEIDTKFGTPHRALSFASEVLPPVLDSVAANLGLRLVAKFDGSFVLESADSSRARRAADDAAHPTRQVLAGGDAFDFFGVRGDAVGMAAYWPSCVQVRFPVRQCAVDHWPPPARYYTATVSLEDLELPVANGHPGCKVFHDLAPALYQAADGPSNRDQLDELAKLIAQRYYGWRHAARDRVYRGIVAYEPDGSCESVTWAYLQQREYVRHPATPRRAEPREAYLVATYVRPNPPDRDPEELHHQLEDCPGRRGSDYEYLTTLRYVRNPRRDGNDLVLDLFEADLLNPSGDFSEVKVGTIRTNICCSPCDTGAVHVTLTCSNGQTAVYSSITLERKNADNTWSEVASHTVGPGEPLTGEWTTPITQTGTYRVTVSYEVPTVYQKPNYLDLSGGPTTYPEFEVTDLCATTEQSYTFDRALVYVIGSVCAYNAEFDVTLGDYTQHVVADGSWGNDPLYGFFYFGLQVLFGPDKCGQTLAWSITPTTPDLQSASGQLAIECCPPISTDWPPQTANTVNQTILTDEQHFCSACGGSNRDRRIRPVKLSLIDSAGQTVLTAISVGTLRSQDGITLWRGYLTYTDTGAPGGIAGPGVCSPPFPQTEPITLGFEVGCLSDNPSFCYDNPNMDVYSVRKYWLACNPNNGDPYYLIPGTPDPDHPSAFQFMAETWVCVDRGSAPLGNPIDLEIDWTAVIPPWQPPSLKTQTSIVEEN
ncbi:MAG: hypothetical protein IRY99_02865 [Isosphaeraceae bacterium]|nr:hypothetical protein [Isosphaeraceae bacterium]